LSRADREAAFLKAATWHGRLDDAEAMLATHPELRSASIHIAAVLGDEGGVRRYVANDPASATAKAPPYAGDALNYLGLSKYLRLHPERTDAFLRTATALLDAGAPAHTGFWNHGEFETALYGAAGVAHNEPLTRLLLARGADPNDEDAVYHVGESRDLGALKAMVETGRVTPENLSLMLIRKHDWHDTEGARWLLEQGTDPNHERTRAWLAIHHALARDNALAMFELLLDHGADPLKVKDGLTAVARAGREGRSDVLTLFARRGVPMDLEGVDRLIAACARGDATSVRAIAREHPGLAGEVLGMGGTLLAKFAGTCNPAGVRQLLDLGVDVAAPFAEGDGYWGEPPGSLAIHVAAWRACTPVVELLIERGSPVDAPDANGMTPLALAVKACVDSYWTEYRSPASARALLEAGASVEGVPYPSGYPELDDLLKAHGAS